MAVNGNRSEKREITSNISCLSITATSTWLIMETFDHFYMTWLMLESSRKHALWFYTFVKFLMSLGGATTDHYYGIVLYHIGFFVGWLVTNETGFQITHTLGTQIALSLCHANRFQWINRSVQSYLKFRTLRGNRFSNIIKWGCENNWQYCLSLLTIFSIFAKIERNYFCHYHPHLHVYCYDGLTLRRQAPRN